MGSKSAKEVLQEIESTRQQIGSLAMVLDGAQVHFMIESFFESLKVIAELLIVSKNTEPGEWNEDSFGSQEDNIKTALELGFTAISTIKMFIAALPENLKEFDKIITPDKLDLIESLLNDV